MDVKAIPALIVGVMVAVVMVGAVLPVFAETTAEQDTFRNSGYFYVDSVDDDETITYAYENHTLTVNGDNVPLPTGSQYPDGLTIIYTEHICIRYDGGDLKVRGVTSHSIATMNITVSEGNITGNYYWTTSPETERAIEWTYTEFVGIVPETTDRVMCKSEPQYIQSDSHIETTGLTKLTNINATHVIHISGTYDDGMTVNLYSSSNGDEITTLTVENISVNATEIRGYDDLYKLNSVTFDVTDGVNTDSVTYTIYTIPAEITVDKTVHPDAVLSTLINLLPLMAGAGLVLGGIVWVMFRKG